MQHGALTCGATIAPRVRGVARIGLGLSLVQARLAHCQWQYYVLARPVWSSWSQQEMSRSKQCNGEGMEGH